MALASLDDINEHLPEISRLTELTDDQFHVDALRVVRGYLSNIYSPETLASWTGPSQTPGLVRAIAGRLIAAWYYGQRVSADTGEWPEYADFKYKEALGFLESLVSGDLTLEEVTEEISVGDRQTSADFYPNDVDDPAPKFTMGQLFA